MSARHTLPILITAALLWLAFGQAVAVAAPPQTEAWPQRVLMTNDNGIDATRIWTLAKAFARHSDTWLVAASQDRSGSSNYLSLGEHKQALTVRRVFQGKNLTAYSVVGYPADCVAFGILGLLKDDPPDLVVSGINGGPNLGVRGWSGSGTIGAARTAALLGIPAIAISGLSGAGPKRVGKVADWVVKLAASSVVRGLKPGEYLTIAIPDVPLAKIRGTRIAPRAPFTSHLYELDRVRHERGAAKPWEVWVAKPTGRMPHAPAGSDIALYRQGYIVITPMRIGEVDKSAISVLREQLDDLPPWPGSHS